MRRKGLSSKKAFFPVGNDPNKEGITPNVLPVLIKFSPSADLGASLNPRKV
jgi:hypothetical protein